MNTVQGLRRVLVLQHQHDPFDRVGIPVLAQDAFTLLMAQRGAAEVTHQDRRSAHLRHHDRADLLQIVNQSDPADDVALIAARDPATPSVGIVLVDRIDDIGDAEAIVLQLLGIEVQLVLAGEAAEIGVVDDAGHGLQRRNHGPALDLRQFLEILAVGLERVAVDLAAGSWPPGSSERRRCPAGSTV